MRSPQAQGLVRGRPQDPHTIPPAIRRALHARDLHEGGFAVERTDGGFRFRHPDGGELRAGDPLGGS